MARITRARDGIGLAAHRTHDTAGRRLLVTHFARRASQAVSILADAAAAGHVLARPSRAGARCGGVRVARLAGGAVGSIAKEPGVALANKGVLPRQALPALERGVAMALFAQGAILTIAVEALVALARNRVGRLRDPTKALTSLSSVQVAPLARSAHFTVAIVPRVTRAAGGIL